MSTPSANCPRCGAALTRAAENPRLLRCEYCGATLCDNLLTKRPTQPLDPTPPPAAASVAIPDLPPEYRRLKRPKPVAPLEAQGCILIFGLIWTIFSVFGMAFGLQFLIRDYASYKQLSREGVDANATITRMWIDDSDDSNTYYVEYQYTVLIKGDPTRFEGSDSVTLSFYKTHEIGQIIEILYADSEPTLTTIKAEFGLKNMLESFLFAGMISLFVLIGLGMLFVSIKALVRLTLLRTNGRQTQGIIFDRWQDTDSEGAPTFYVAYAFKAGEPQGQQKLITRTEQNRTLYLKYCIGDALPVRYLRDNPFVCEVLPER